MGSAQFLTSYLAEKAKSNFIPNRVLDCGAGIGRIAKELLCSIFKTVFKLIK
jgi:ubiquinone/menaquinone biosynthesis C-methylase UbiE